MEPLIAVFLIAAAVGAYIGRGLSRLSAYLDNKEKGRK